VTDIKLLDCTLRDGGYYTAWHFSPDLVERYLDAMAAAGVDWIEIGYRFRDPEGFNGLFAYSKDRVLRQLNRHGLKLAVMVDAKEFLSDGRPDSEALSSLFAPAVESSVGMVRIAATYGNYEASFGLAETLKHKGYETTINMMQISTLDEDQVASMSSAISESGVVDVLYIADSYGSMLPEDVDAVVTNMRAHASIPVGVHFHNNLGLGVANTVQAVASGAAYIDATVTGMGRGAGNAETEYLSLFMGRAGTSKWKSEPLLELAMESFAPMQAQHEWGPSLPYKLSALYGIHPTYCQRMLGQGRYTPHQVVKAMNELASAPNRGRFDEAELAAAINASKKGDTSDVLAGAGRLDDVAPSNAVLVLGSGPSVTEHRQAIEEFVRTRRPLVLSCNVHPTFAAGLVDYVVAINEERIERDVEALSSDEIRKILPLERIDSALVAGFGARSVVNCGCEYQPNRLDMSGATVVIPADVVAHYAIAIAARLASNVVYVAGFDGYPDTDSASRAQNREMDQFLELYQQSGESVPLVTITPSRYRIPVQSVYGFLE